MDLTVSATSYSKVRLKDIGADTVLKGHLVHFSRSDNPPSRSSEEASQNPSHSHPVAWVQLKRTDLPGSGTSSPIVISDGGNLQLLKSRVSEWIQLISREEFYLEIGFMEGASSYRGVFAGDRIAIWCRSTGYWYSPDLGPV